MKQFDEFISERLKLNNDSKVKNKLDPRSIETCKNK